MQSQDTFSEEETKSLHRLNCAVIWAIILAILGLISAIAGFLLMFRKSNRIEKIKQFVVSEVRSLVDTTKMCSNGILSMPSIITPSPRVFNSIRPSFLWNPVRTILETPIRCGIAVGGRAIRRCLTELYSIMMGSIRCRPRRFNSSSPRSRTPRPFFRRRFLRSFSSRSASLLFTVKEEASGSFASSSSLVRCVRRSVPRERGCGRQRPRSVC